MDSSRIGKHGYVLLVMLIMVTVLLVSLTAVLPSVYQQAKREREEETIFRGEQYARAIFLFHHALGRWPTSVKELLKTNGVRYLRRAYRDPLIPNGRWRFIHATANGIVIDSEDQPVKPATQSANTFSSGFGQSSGKKKKPKVPRDCEGSSDSFGSQGIQEGTLLGAFIIGVAPCSNLPSLIVWNGRDYYNHWEFTALKYAPYALPPSNTVQPSSPSQTPQPGLSQPAGMPNSPGGE